MDATPPRHYKWAALATVSAGVYVSVIAGGVVNISLPSISSEFSADISTVQWIISIYLLVIGALLLPAGRAADILGRKRVYVTGYLFFIGGSMLAAAADNLPWLLAARGIQAIGGAGIQANGMAISAAVFPPEERGKALGINATVVAMGAISGPIVGGMLVDIFGWRSVFLLVAGVSMLGLMAASRILQERWITTASGRRQGLDWVGMTSSAVAIVGVLLVFTQGHRLGWTSAPIAIAAVASVAAMAVFVATELRVSSPMVDLSLFKRRAVGLGSLAAFLAFSATSANLFLMPFYLQGILGFEARTAGLAMTPMAGMLAVFGPVSGRLSDKFGARGLSTAGAVLSAVAMLGLTRLSEDSHVAEAIIPLLFLGMGLGLFQPANQNSVLGAVERQRYGLVSAFLTLMRNLGQVIGLAIATLVVTLAVTSLGISADLGNLRQAGVDPDPRLIDGFITGLRRSFMVSAVILALAAMASLSRGPRTVSEPEPPGGTRPPSAEHPTSQATDSPRDGRK